MKSKPIKVGSRVFARSDASIKGTCLEISAGGIFHRVKWDIASLNYHGDSSAWIERDCIASAETKTKRAQFYVSIELYRVSHLKRPHGRGNWAFKVYGTTTEKVTIFFNDTYGNALKKAKAYCFANLFNSQPTIEVLP